MLKYLVLLLTLVASSALAQQAQFTPSQQAAMSLGQQLGLSMQNAAELAAQIQALNAQLVEKDKRIKELEAKKSAQPPEK